MLKKATVCDPDGFECNTNAPGSDPKRIEGSRFETTTYSADGYFVTGGTNSLWSTGSVDINPATGSGETARPMPTA